MPKHALQKDCFHKGHQDSIFVLNKIFLTLLSKRPKKKVQYCNVFFEFKTTGLDDRTNFMYFDKAVNGRDKIIECTACMCCESRTAQHTVSEIILFQRSTTKRHFPANRNPCPGSKFSHFFQPGRQSLCK